MRPALTPREQLNATRALMDALVEEWHTSFDLDSGRLYDHLRLSVDEYATWLESNTVPNDYLHRFDDLDFCDCDKLVRRDEHHCWIHHANEAVEDPYIVCGECGHVYVTAEDLEAAWAREVATDPNWLGKTIPKADEIGFCQECIHDF